MRQAGRSLPEYRALRGEGTHPRRHRQARAGRRDHPAAGAPLRGGRRHPLQRHRGAGGRHRVRRRHRPGHRSGGRPAVPRGRPTCDRLRPLEPDGRHAATCSRPSRILAGELAVPLIGFAGAPFTVASYLVEGRPSRTYARTKALMHGDAGPVARADGAPGRPGHRVAAQPDRGRGPAPSSCSTAGWAPSARPTTRAFVAPHSRPDLRRASPPSGVPRIHFGVDTGELLALMAATGADVVGVDWRVPARRGRPSGGRRPRRAGQPRPGPLLRPLAGGREPGPPGAGRAAPATRGHVFNLGHGVAPRHRPRRCSGGSSSWSTPGRRRPGDARQPGPAAVSRTGVVVMAYGTPRAPGDVEAYYTDIRRGRPPTPEQLADLVRRYDAIGGISPLAERTEAQRAALAEALDAAAPGRLHRGARPEARRPVHRGRGGRRWPPRASAGPSAWCWPRTTRPPASASTRPGRGRRRSRPASSGRPSTAGTSSPPTSTSSPPAVAAGPHGACPSTTRCCSPPTRCRSGRWSTTPTPTSCARAPQAVAERVGLDPWADWAIAWQSAGRTPEPWRGPDILEVIGELAADRAQRRRGGVCRRGSCRTTSRCSTTSTSRRPAWRRDAGLAFARTRSLNDDPTVMAALAERVIRAADEGGPDRTGGVDG